ncbi:MAG: hypothetical protein A2086_01425 [Spirochaetes bacterium GWD1_27_9]|nr:MAG: hypothetical protein A2Z98_01845 [Spirochaetes bacterium GWB1_27_13]OHD24417.1 MAG: hypothetical protein A2Y34_04200 [Spirochaetes bacterium GWC1_27_15]OHD36936.1 MAG: hypothetical protein A2086_01425 [Spirochaetes bacterium GWD1_27_9]
MIFVVLVEPKGEENIGSVSRAMLNFGFENLILINPLCNHLSEKSLNYSVHSKYILENAVILPTLEEVLKKSDLSIALTRRIGSHRRKDVSLENLADFVTDYKNQNIFLVFGREAHGLTNEELLMCDLLCHIETNEKFPSINLSHSVILVLHEINKIFANKIKIETAKAKDFNFMYDEIIDTLNYLDFFKNPDPKPIKNYIKKIMLRAKLTKEDTLIIKNIFRSIKGMVKKRF